MAKRHGGTDHVQGQLHRGPPPKRVYGLHGGTAHPQGKVHDGVQPRQYGFHGGTNALMGVLRGKRQK